MFYFFRPSSRVLWFIGHPREIGDPGLKKSYSCQTISFVLIISLFIGCGKKQKNIFVFDHVKSAKVSIFDLPSVRGINLDKGYDGVCITWQPVQLDDIKQPGLVFRGYNVYCITKSGIIPKKPINKKILTETLYVDQYKKNNTCTVGYLVRAVFSVGKEFFYAPTSRIAKIV